MLVVVVVVLVKSVGVVTNAVVAGEEKNIDGEKPQLSTWRLRDEVLTLFQEV